MTNSDTHDNGREEQWRVVPASDPNTEGRFTAWQLFRSVQQADEFFGGFYKDEEEAQEDCNYLNELEAARAQAGLAQRLGTTLQQVWDDLNPEMRMNSGELTALGDEVAQCLEALTSQAKLDLQRQLQAQRERAEAAEQREHVLYQQLTAAERERVLAQGAEDAALYSLYQAEADRDEAVGLVERIFLKFKQNRKDVGQDWVSAPPRSWEDGWMNDADALLRPPAQRHGGIMSHIRVEDCAHQRWMQEGPDKQLYCYRCKVRLKVIAEASTDIVEQLQGTVAAQAARIESLTKALREIEDVDLKDKPPTAAFYMRDTAAAALRQGQPAS